MPTSKQKKLIDIVRVTLEIRCDRARLSILIKFLLIEIIDILELIQIYTIASRATENIKAILYLASIEVKVFEC